MTTSSDGRQSILLESGTNELELLVFQVGSTRYGVNVAKVREIIGQVKCVRVPKSHEATVGVFKLRETVIPLVDLGIYFRLGSNAQTGERAVILMEFNDRQLGFQVDRVHRIYRISWTDVQPMPMNQQHDAAAITSVCQLDDHLVLIVDFEKIAFDLAGDDNVFHAGCDSVEPNADLRGRRRILLAEDSPTIRRAIESTLVKSGYGNVTCACDGSEAWSVLESCVDDWAHTGFTAIVTDIEMPQMDGLHLCKRIKEHAVMRTTPVVVFSSLVSDDNLKKCEAVGANAALTKPQMVRLIEILDQLMAERNAPEGEPQRTGLLTIS